MQFFGTGPCREPSWLLFVGLYKQKGRSNTFLKPKALMSESVVNGLDN